MTQTILQMAIGLAASIDLLSYQMFHLWVMVSYWSLLHIPKAPFVQITHQGIHMHQSRGPALYSVWSARLHMHIHALACISIHRQCSKLTTLTVSPIPYPDPIPFPQDNLKPCTQSLVTRPTATLYKGCTAVGQLLPFAES